MKLYINTLGEFDIKANGQSMLKESSRTYRIYKLFEYFLTFRNKKLLPDTIIDNLLSESDSDDPKNMLRTQIFRLRKIIKMLLPDGIDAEEYININFTNGYYCLEIGENTVVDIDEFERLIHKGDAERSSDTNSAIELYEEAISLYKGLYLSDNAYEVWLVPTRNYYQRLYLKTLYKLIEIFKSKHEDESIISLCEEALLYEPYEELIHMNLMDAMLNLGHSKAVINHYDYALNMLEKEMDIRPSPQFMDFPKKIQNNFYLNGDIDISSIKIKLEDETAVGAMYCSFEYFRFMFNVQKRKSFRNNQNDFLCIININQRGNANKNNAEFSKCTKTWTKLLESCLRKGDVFTFCNNNQVLIILYDVRGEGIQKIENRIKNKIIEYIQISSNEVNIVFQPIASDNTKI